MSDTRIALDDVNQPLAGTQARAQKTVSIGQLAFVISLVLAAGLVIVGVSQHKLLNRQDLPSDPAARAIALMEQTPYVDGHNDLAWTYRLQAAGSVFGSTFDLNKGVATLQTDVPRLTAGKAGGIFFSAYVRCGMSDAVRAAMEQVDVIKSIVARYSNTFQLALTPADITNVFNAGRVATLIGLEGGQAIDSSLGALRQFYDMGVRYMSLTGSCNLPWAQSCCDANPVFPVTGLTKNGGKSLDGVQVVKEMNRVGMMVDLSYASHQTMRDALNVTTAPVIFTHSGVYSLVNNARNIPDDVIDLVAANQGLIMVSFANELTNTQPTKPNTIGNIADHIDYILVRTNSYANIALGSGFEGNDEYTSADFPADLNDVSKVPALIAELISRGYTDDAIRAILSGNLARVMNQVQSVAQSANAVQDENRLIYQNTCRSNF